MLDEDEVKELSQVMSNLGTVSSSLVEKLLIEFVSQMSSTGSLMCSSSPSKITRRLSGRRPTPRSQASATLRLAACCPPFLESASATAITAAAFARRAALNTSRGVTSTVSSVPRPTSWYAST